MITTDIEALVEWVAANPAPIHMADVPSWSARVRSQVGASALTILVHLLAGGDDEQQYQAVAAVRALGAEVWAEDEITWLVRLPGERHALRVLRSDLAD